MNAHIINVISIIHLAENCIKGQKIIVTSVMTELTLLCKTI